MTDQTNIRPRVALIYLLDLRAHAQIADRAAAQIAVFQESGIDAFGLCMDRGLGGKLPANFEGLRTRTPKLLRAFSEARHLRRFLSAHDPDALIVRYGFASSTLLRIAKAYPLILEIHSDDTVELPTQRHVRTYARLSGRTYRSRVLGAARGAVFVTRALVDLPAFGALRGRRTVIPNGVTVPAKPLPVPRNSRTVIGYSVGYAAPWQGLDRLARLADELPEFEFRLVVPDASIASGISADRVQIVTTRNAAEYRRAISSFDVALGGLALDRKGLEIASALKVRESVALGIPTLLFSRDEDLEEIESLTIRTVARGPWEPAEVAAAVREFVAGAVGMRVPDELRRRVDIREKAQQYAAFVIDTLEGVDAGAQRAQR